MCGRGENVAVRVQIGQCLPAAVVDLQQGFSALLVGDFGHFAQTRQVFFADGFGLAVKGFAAFCY